MKNKPKKVSKIVLPTAIYTIVYAFISFLLVAGFIFLTLASRGFILFTPYIFMPFIAGFFYIVGLSLSILCWIISKKFRIFAQIMVGLYVIEAFALVLPLLALFIGFDATDVVAIGAVLSIPVTKLAFLVVGIVLCITTKLQTNQLNVGGTSE